VLEAEDEASSAQSSITLSSKTSKRSFENVDEDEEPQPVLSSPGKLLSSLHILRTSG
jgi:hypothetical protein